MSHAFSPKVGTRVTTRASFSEAGALDDPGLVSCKVRTPAGVVTTYVAPSVVNDGVGLYHLDFDITESGLWTVEWIGDGSGPNVVECRSFTADPACL